MQDEYESIFLSLVKNGISLLICRVIIMVSTAVVSFAMIRYLNTGDFGSFSVSYAIFSIFYNLTLFGLGNVMIREIAKDKTKAWSYYIGIMMIGLILSILAIAALKVVFIFLPYDAFVKTISYTLFIALFPAFAISAAENYFTAIEKVHHFTFGFFIASLVESLWILVILISGGGLKTVVCAMVGVKCLFAAAMTYLVRRGHPGEKIFPSMDLSGSILKVAPVFAAVGILVGILLKIDVLFLSNLRDLHATGIYCAAFKFVTLWSMLGTSFISVFYPIASAYHKSSPEIFEKASHILMKAAGLFVSAAVVITLNLSEEIIRLLFKPEYNASFDVLRILIFLVIPFCFTLLFGLILSACHWQKCDLVSIALGLASAIVLHAVLVRHWGYFGSAWAALLSFCIVQSMQMYFIQKRIMKIQWNPYLTKPFAVLAIGVLSSFWVIQFSWGIKILMTVIILGLAMYIFRAVTRQDILFIKERILSKTA